MFFLSFSSTYFQFEMFNLKMEEMELVGKEGEGN